MALFNVTGTFVVREVKDHDNSAEKTFTMSFTADSGEAACALFGGRLADELTNAGDSLFPELEVEYTLRDVTFEEVEEVEEQEAAFGGKQRVVIVQDLDNEHPEIIGKLGTVVSNEDETFEDFPYAVDCDDGTQVFCAEEELLAVK